MGNEPQTQSPRELLEASYVLIDQVTRDVTRRYRLSWEEAEELSSIVRLRLVDDDYAILRKFEGRSSLRTYLRTVVGRICLDCRTSEWGRWRPSAEARRLGPLALRLERLTDQDGLTFDEACEVLRTNHRITESRAEIEAIFERLPQRTVRRRRALPLDAATLVAAAPAERERASRRVRKALLQAISRLTLHERKLLSLRFQQGWPIVRIARTLCLDQHATYRTFDRIFRGLRASLNEVCAEQTDVFSLR
jgi:RNA polymerase sigma factor for flagellar operon FliA